MLAIKRDFRSAPIDAATRQLLEFAEKLTNQPAEMAQADVEQLRSHGWTDRDVLDTVHNAAFFSYINRVAEALGVEVEPFMQRGGETIAPDETIP